VGAAHAAAAISCTYDSALGALTVEAVPPNEDDGDTVTFGKSGGSPGAILVNGATCVDTAPVAAAAAVSNVDTIQVDLDRGYNVVIIDNTNGRVTEPGFTQTEGDINEIEWIFEDTRYTHRALFNSRTDSDLTGGGTEEASQTRPTSAQYKAWAWVVPRISAHGTRIYPYLYLKSAACTRAKISGFAIRYTRLEGVWR